MDLFEDRIKQASDAVFYDLINHGISSEHARNYVNKHIKYMIETGTYTEKCISDLIDISKQGEHIWPDVREIIKPFVLTFAERARLELERESTELSEEELLARKEDLLALEEMEAICPGNKECSVTNEQKELIQVLTEGLDPEKFDFGIKSSVTKEQIEQFRDLGKKFGLDEESIAQRIARVTFGTPTAYVQKIISQQASIDQRREKGLAAMTSRRSFKIKDR